MTNVGSAPAGKTLIGAGNGASPTFADIGTNSGLNNHGVVISQGNSAFASTSPGSVGMVLTSNGAGSNPSFQNASASGAITTITGDSGGAETPSGGNFNILGTGSITVTGTAATETVQLTGLTNHAVLVGAGTTTITKVGPSATAGQVLQSGGASADPSYSTATYPTTSGTTGTILRSNGTNFVNTTAIYPTTTTVNRILYSSATNTISEITAAANSILSTDGSSVPTFGTSLTNDYTFTSSTAGGNRILTVTNTDNTNSASNALLTTSVGGTSAGDPFTRYAVGSTRSYAWGIDNSDSQSFKMMTSANATASPSAGSTTLRMDTSGNVALPLNGCCTADLNTGLTNATGDATFINPLIFDTATGSFFDQNSNYNTTTGIFTANATGKYLVTARVTLNNLGAAHTDGIIRINLNGAAYAINQFNPGVSRNSANEFTCQISCIIPIAATGTCAILIQVSGSTKTVGVKGNTSGSFTSFSAVLIS